MGAQSVGSHSGSVSIFKFVSPTFGGGVVGWVAWTHRQVVVCAFRSGDVLRAGTLVVAA